MCGVFPFAKDQEKGGYFNKRGNRSDALAEKESLHPYCLNDTYLPPLGKATFTSRSTHLFRHPHLTLLF